MCNSITDTTRQYILPQFLPKSLRPPTLQALSTSPGKTPSKSNGAYSCPVQRWLKPMEGPKSLDPTFILLKRSNLVTSAKAWPEGPPGYCESLVLGWLFISLACHSSSYGCYNMTQIYSNCFLIPLAICENVVKLLQFIETPIKNRTLKCIKKAEGPDHQPMVECSKYLWTWSHGWSHRWLPITQELLRLHVLWAQRTTC